MSQNIYDDPDFFAGYATLDRSIKGLDGAPEWPAIQQMLPALAGLRVVDGSQPKRRRQQHCTHQAIYE